MRRTWNGNLPGVSRLAYIYRADEKTQREDKRGIGKKRGEGGVILHISLVSR